jgi:hypothetical protein
MHMHALELENAWLYQYNDGHCAVPQGAASTFCLRPGTSFPILFFSSLLALALGVANVDFFIRHFYRMTFVIKCDFLFKKTPIATWLIKIYQSYSYSALLLLSIIQSWVFCNIFSTRLNLDQIMQERERDRQTDRQTYQNIDIYIHIDLIMIGRDR